MRIHYLSSSTLISDSANGVHVMKMAEALTGLNHEVTLHALKGRGETSQNVFSHYGVNQNCYFKLKRHDHDNLWICRVLNAFCRWIPTLRIGGLTSLIYASTALKFRNGVDLLVSRNMYWLFPFRNTYPFIYETHSPPESIVHQYLESKLVHSKNCKGFVVISGKLKEAYLKIFPNIKDKIIVAHDAAEDPKEAESVIEKTLKRPIKNIGYVGNLYNGRGIDVIIAAAKALPDYQFHIVGGSAKPIEKIFKVIPSNIIFYGHRPYEQLKEFYSIFDLVLAPYQRKVAVFGNAGDTSRYMSPLKIFEYMAWGLPVICSDLPVLKEVLFNQYNALLVPPDQPDYWVDAIKKISSDNKLRRSLAQNSRKKFLKAHRWSTRGYFILNSIDLRT